MLPALALATQLFVCNCGGSTPCSERPTNDCGKQCYAPLGQPLSADGVCWEKTRVVACTDSTSVLASAAFVKDPFGRCWQVHDGTIPAGWTRASDECSKVVDNCDEIR